MKPYVWVFFFVVQSWSAPSTSPADNVTYDSTDVLLLEIGETANKVAAAATIEDISIPLHNLVEQILFLSKTGVSQGLKLDNLNKLEELVFEVDDFISGLPRIVKYNDSVFKQKAEEFVAPRMRQIVTLIELILESRNKETTTEPPRETTTNHLISADNELEVKMLLLRIDEKAEAIASAKKIWDITSSLPSLVTYVLQLKEFGVFRGLALEKFNELEKLVYEVEDFINSLSREDRYDDDKFQRKVDEFILPRMKNVSEISNFIIEILETKPSIPTEQTTGKPLATEPSPFPTTKEPTAKPPKPSDWIKTIKNCLEAIKTKLLYPFTEFFQLIFDKLSGAKRVLFG